MPKSLIEVENKVMVATAIKQLFSHYNHSLPLLEMVRDIPINDPQLMSNYKSNLTKIKSLIEKKNEQVQLIVEYKRKNKIPQFHYLKSVKA